MDAYLSAHTWFTYVPLGLALHALPYQWMGFLLCVTCYNSFGYAFFFCCIPGYPHILSQFPVKERSALPTPELTEHLMTPRRCKALINSLAACYTRCLSLNLGTARGVSSKIRTRCWPSKGDLGIHSRSSVWAEGRNYLGWIERSSPYIFLLQPGPAFLALPDPVITVTWLPLVPFGCPLQTFTSIFLQFHDFLYICCC